MARMRTHPAPRRILRPGGLLMAGLDNGVNFITDDDEERIVNHLPFNPLKNADQRDQLAEADDGVQFSHTLDEQIRGQIQAGLRIVDLYEDTNGYGRLHELGIPSFWATRRGAGPQRNRDDGRSRIA